MLKLRRKRLTLCIRLACLQPFLVYHGGRLLHRVHLLHGVHALRRAARSCFGQVLQVLSNIADIRVLR